jgi:AAA+ ATPase superfamily predicted ATPase
MYQSKESIIQYLKTEKQVYENMLKFLEDYERGSVSLNLKPIEQLLQILESVDMETSTDYTNKRICQSAIFLNRILLDLIHLTRNSGLSQDVKKRYISKLQSLLDRSEKLIKTYYDHYGYLPRYYRFYYYWYEGERNHYPFLPYYPEDYYYVRYPPKAELSTVDVIWKDILGQASDNENSLFVPRSFLCLDQSQYNEYTFLKLYEAIEDKPTKVLPLDMSDQDKLHSVADKIIEDGKRAMKQKSG